MFAEVTFKNISNSQVNTTKHMLSKALCKKNRTFVRN